MSKDDRKITITSQVSRRVWYQFVTLCRAHDVRVYAGVEQALQDVLDRSGVGDRTEVGAGDNG